jgi:hypothetical protein
MSSSKVPAAPKDDEADIERNARERRVFFTVDLGFGGYSARAGGNHLLNCQTPLDDRGFTEKGKFYFELVDSRP